jgi:AraC-like DNA-binding protein
MLDSCEVSNGAWGDRLAGYFHIASAPSVRTRSFANNQFAVTRLQDRALHPGMSELIPVEDGFLCELQLLPLSYHELWCHGRRVLTRAYASDSIRIVDLRDEVRALIEGPLDALSFYLPRSVLDEFADDAGAPRIDRLACEPGLHDPVLSHLGAALLPTLLQSTNTSAMFVEHVALAVNAHILNRYGGLASPSMRTVGGLSPSRERRAKEFLTACLDSDVSVAQVAQECGLSRAHFIKAFRQSTGLTPHKWLQIYRIDRVKSQLMATSASIVDIALACGFADQSHLTRTFGQIVGVPPATWRRQRAH